MWLFALNMTWTRCEVYCDLDFEPSENQWRAATLCEEFSIIIHHDADDDDDYDDADDDDDDDADADDDDDEWKSMCFSSVNMFELLIFHGQRV